MNSKTKKKIAIIGGGPSGIMAAYSASLSGKADIFLYERNEKLGKKLYITGKGRCNITNSCDPQSFFDSIINNRKFFYSAFYTFDNYSLMSLIEENGTKLKKERGGRVFPDSDKSSDILKTLEKMLYYAKTNIILNTKIKQIKVEKNKFLLNSDYGPFDKLIIASGGKSYPKTGSDGFMYGLVKKLGHTIKPLEAGLCGMETLDADLKTLSGLSLKNVSLTVSSMNNAIYSELGEMEFTHYGVSGPMILSASSLIENSKIKEYVFIIDLKPGLSEEKLNARILRDLAKDPNKEVKNSLGRLLPYRLMELILFRSGIDSSKKGNQLTKEERHSLVEGLKKFRIHPVALRPIEEAIITKGGISLSEIDPSTMESKIVDGLYFAGEIVDLDALTGGFNLQIAFSTGYLAGQSASE